MFAQVVAAAPDINELILKYIQKSLWAGAIGLGGFVIMYPLRSIAKAVKERFAVLDSVKAELETQRTNHLSHIQKATEDQTKVLETQTKVLDKMAATLSDMRGDQRELIGKISIIASSK